MRGSGERLRRPRTIRPSLGAAGMVTALLCVAAVLGSCGGSSKPSVKGGSEVTAQPVSTSGANPFTAAVGTDTPGVKPPPAAASPGATGGPATTSGSTPGLYGGTRDHHSCDAKKLIAFLEQNPGKAAAWAQTLGIQTSQIRGYVNGLTAVTLRTDTRVTNHGYVNGHANPIQSVLEAGTAVFVDRYGRPVVKCYCGNPLTPPELLTRPSYTGPLWSGFDPGHITIINQSTTIINIFVIYDFNTGRTFHLTPGANGTVAPNNQTPSSSTPAPPPQATTPTQTGTTQYPNPSCPQGEVYDPSSSDGCSPVNTQTGTTTEQQSPQTDTSTDQLPQCDPVNPQPPCHP